MKKERNRQGLQKRLIAVWVALAIIMATAITATSISLLSSQIRKDREQSVIGAAKLAANAVDGNMVDTWLANGKNSEYEETFSALDDILHNTPYLKYLYIYQIREDGCYVVLDTDPEAAGLLGEFQEFDETFLPLVPSLLEGKNIDIIESNDSFGWLLTQYEPIFDSNGKCVAYAGADISMDEIRDYTRSYVLLIISIAAAFLIACIIIGLKMHINTNRAGELEMLREQQQRDKQLIREIIESFAKVIDMKDSYTQGHSSRVAKYTAMLAKELGYDDDTIEQYYNIALMHDIGKVSIMEPNIIAARKLNGISLIEGILFKFMFFISFYSVCLLFHNTANITTIYYIFLDE